MLSACLLLALGPHWPTAKSAHSSVLAAHFYFHFYFYFHFCSSSSFLIARLHFHFHLGSREIARRRAGRKAEVCWEGPPWGRLFPSGLTGLPVWAPIYLGRQRAAAGASTRSKRCSWPHDKEAVCLAGPPRPTSLAPARAAQFKEPSKWRPPLERWSFGPSCGPKCKWPPMSVHALDRIALHCTAWQCALHALLALCSACPYSAVQCSMQSSAGAPQTVCARPPAPPHWRPHERASEAKRARHLDKLLYFGPPACRPSLRQAHRKH